MLRATVVGVFGQRLIHVVKHFAGAVAFDCFDIAIVFAVDEPKQMVPFAVSAKKAGTGSFIEVRSRNTGVTPLDA
jgi:hypothetical protein